MLTYTSEYKKKALPCNWPLKIQIIDEENAESKKKCDSKKQKRISFPCQNVLRKCSLICFSFSLENITVYCYSAFNKVLTTSVL